MAASANVSTSVAGVPQGVIVHPAFALWAPVWRKLAHTYEGTGGFLDGTYLVPHPREWKDYDADTPQKPTKKLVARRKLARYENIAATILDQKKAALFRGSITRTVGDPKKPQPHPIERWWQNVDGAGTHIADWMAQAFIPSGVFGHVVHVMDRPAGPRPVTKADEKAPYLRLYTPLDIPDWLVNDRGQITAIKLLEAVARTSLDAQPPSVTDYQERLITEGGWRVRRAGQTGGAETAHTFGRVPAVYHYAKRRALSPKIGASILSDPQLFIDLYNLTSEIRELLRNQTFGILNAPLGGKEGETTDVEAAKLMLGAETGTSNIAFSPQPLQYVQPDTGNITVYQDERRELLRTIYRLCSIPWESDSKDAEAEGSLKLKREDMNQILADYADECERAEYEIAELWFRAEYGADRWEAEMQQANVVIRYPDTFDVTPFAEVLEQAQAALTLEMGPTFMAELKVRLIAKFLPDADAQTTNKVEKEIRKLVKMERDPKTLVRKAAEIARQIADGAAAA